MQKESWRSKLKSNLRFLRESRAENLVYIVLAVIIIGTIGFSLTEGWSWSDAFYATVITTTTVGYGDMVPVTRAGRTFAVLYTVVSIGLVGYGISQFAAVWLERQKQRRQQRAQEQLMAELSRLTGHVIVCGATVMTQYVLFELLSHKRSIVVVAEDEQKLQQSLAEVSQMINSETRLERYARLENMISQAQDNRSLMQLAQEIGIQVLVANPMQSGTLLKAGVEKAGALLSILNDDRDNLLVVLTAHELAEKRAGHKVTITTIAREDENVSKLRMAGADNVVAANSIASTQMVLSIVDETVSHYWQSVLRQELLIESRDASSSGLVGKTVSQIMQDEGIVITAVKRGDHYLSLPAPDTAVLADDILIVLSKNKQWKPPQGLGNLQNSNDEGNA